MSELKITGPGDALAMWRKADAANDVETKQRVEDAVYLKLDPTEILRMKIEVPSSENYREEGFATEAEFIAEVELRARTSLMVIWNNGKVRAGNSESAQ